MGTEQLWLKQRKTDLDRWGFGWIFESKLPCFMDYTV